LSAGNLLTDNPELYEHQFPDPEHLAARFVLDVVHTYGDGTRTLLDVGSGTGRDAGHLADAGLDVVGIDVSSAMVEHAVRHHPRARFTEADMRTFELATTFDVLTCLDSAMLYCHTNTELRGFLERCARHLRPGGLLIAEMRNGAFFLGNTELLDGTRTRTVTWQGVPYTSRTTLWIDHAEQLLRRRRVWEWPGAAGPVEQRSAWRLLFPQELRLLLDLAGFETVALFDGPGPRTEPSWRSAGPFVPWTALAGDRLHVVARRRPVG
jgi:SAM-dependent methyltransferase